MGYSLCTTIRDYNPGAARALFNADGWVLDSATAIRMKNGEKLGFEYGTTISATRSKVAQLASADLKATGVDANLQFCSAKDFFAVDGPINTGKSQFEEFAWLGAVESNYSAWTCDERWDLATALGATVQQYCNYDLDTTNGLFNLGGTRHDIAASAQAKVIMVNDVVVVPLVACANSTIVSDRLQNFGQTNVMEVTYEVAQWSFK